MLIEDLIKELLTYNPKAEVTLTYSEDIALSYITENGLNKSNTPYVFIEPCDKYMED